jgi:large subunit ribosomal protein L4
MPRKMRRQALRSALSVKAADSQLVVLDGLEMAEPKTKEIKGILENLGITSSALILLPQRDEMILRSVRNLPKVRTLVAQYVNVRDLLKYDYILVPLASLEVIEGFLGQAVQGEGQ